MPRCKCDSRNLTPHFIHYSKALFVAPSAAEGDDPLLLLNFPAQAPSAAMTAAMASTVSPFVSGRYTYRTARKTAMATVKGTKACVSERHQN